MNLGSFLRAHRFYESRAAIAAYRGLRASASKLGMHVVLKTFYSPIPELSELPADIFERRSALAGIAWDLDAQLGVLAGHAEAMAEFRPPVRAMRGTARGYVADNPSYGPLDATILHGFIRTLKPGRVVGRVPLHRVQAQELAREAIQSGRPAGLESFCRDV